MAPGKARVRILLRPQLSLVAQLIDELLLVGKLAGRMLRIDEFAVYVDVEYTPPAFYQNGFCVESAFQLGSQTDRFRFVISRRAVGDRDVHNLALVDRPSG